MGILRKIFGESFKELQKKELELIRNKKKQGFNEEKFEELVDEIVEIKKQEDKKSQFIEEINKKNEEFKQYEERRQLRKEKLVASFNGLLESMPNYNINQKDVEYNKNNVSLMPEIRFSNITIKTIPENISCFVVVDVETTGLKATDSIIELSAIRFEDFTPIESFSTLIKPKKNIPENIIELTGITNEMVDNAPSFSSIVDSFINFIGKSNIVGHNLGYDLKMLWSNGANIFEIKHKYYDTLDLSHKTLKKIGQKWNREFSYYEEDYEGNYDVENYKLDTICEFYGIYRDNSHRSLSDCLATGLVFKDIVDTRTNK